MITLEQVFESQFRGTDVEMVQPFSLSVQPH